MNTENVQQEEVNIKEEIKVENEKANTVMTASDLDDLVEKLKHREQYKIVMPNNLDSSLDETPTGEQLDGLLEKLQNMDSQTRDNVLKNINLINERAQLDLGKVKQEKLKELKEVKKLQTPEEIRKELRDKLRLRTSGFKTGRLTKVAKKYTLSKIEKKEQEKLEKLENKDKVTQDSQVTQDSKETQETQETQATQATQATQE